MKPGIDFILCVLEAIFGFCFGPIPRGVQGEGPDSHSLRKSMVLGRFRPDTGDILFFVFYGGPKHRWVVSYPQHEDKKPRIYKTSAAHRAYSRAYHGAVRRGMTKVEAGIPDVQSDLAIESVKPCLEGGAP